jgi:hypothetical protein
MMMFLLLLLASWDEAAQAGSAYREAVEAVRQERYDEAVAKLQEAIRFEPRESARFQYRDKDGRQSHPYHPHFVWSQARILQGRAEKDPVRQRQLYREAITHLELTSHQQAAALLETARKELAVVEKNAAAAPAPDAPLQALRREVGSLCDREQFVEAFKLLTLRGELLDKFPGSRVQLAETIGGHRKTVLERYERSLELGLETVAVTSPIEKPDSIPLLLQPALPPATVMETPDGRFAWLRDFLALYRKEMPLLRNPSAAAPAEILRSGRAFEQSSLKALAAGSFAGFRASLSVAHAIRWSRIQLLSGGKDDSTLDGMLRDGEAALEELRKGLPASEADSLANFAGRLRASRADLEARGQTRTRVQGWIERTERAFAKSMADPDLLKELAKEASALEDLPTWTEAPARFRARVLFDSALLEGVAALLEGEPLSGLPERTTSKFRHARSLDPEVRKPWKGRLSPKLETWIEESER